MLLMVTHLFFIELLSWIVEPQRSKVVPNLLGRESLGDLGLRRRGVIVISLAFGHVADGCGQGGSRIEHEAQRQGSDFTGGGKVK